MMVSRLDQLITSARPDADLIGSELDLRARFMEKESARHQVNKKKKKKRWSKPTRFRLPASFHFHLFHLRCCFFCFVSFRSVFFNFFFFFGTQDEVRRLTARNSELEDLNASETQRRLAEVRGRVLSVNSERNDSVDSFRLGIDVVIDHEKVATINKKR